MALRADWPAAANSVKGIQSRLAANTLKASPPQACSSHRCRSRAASGRPGCCRSRPVSCSTRSPPCSIAISSSFGVTNLSQRWLPPGSQRRMYSAPTIASAKLLSVRLSVATIISPPGFTISAQALDEQRHVGDVLDHLHRKHQVEPRALLGQLLGGGAAVVDRRARFGRRAVAPPRYCSPTDRRPSWPRPAGPAARSGCRRRSRCRGWQAVQRIEPLGIAAEAAAAWSRM